MKTLKVLAPVAAAALVASPALAHVGPGAHDSFAAGFGHPFSGLDHMLAMVAVGLWAAMLGGRALILVPAAFVGVMMLGFIAGAAGVPLPFVEPAILASVVVLGLLVALALPMSALAGGALVGFFALFHGHAHGTEVGTAGFLAYGAGFVAATVLLHVIGIVSGIALGRFGPVLLRVAGGATALGGLMLMAG
ncbi:HupE/UreJ family protein [Chelativorans composti]|uniref:HupE/UreJ family protein n=1 Tax=Chelativorans composti TaxID=768533 RepID=A0ABW5DG94_9HYPH